MKEGWTVTNLIEGWLGFRLFLKVFFLALDKLKLRVTIEYAKNGHTPLCLFSIGLIGSRWGWAWVRGGMGLGCAFSWVNWIRAGFGLG